MRGFKRLAVALILQALRDATRGCSEAKDFLRQVDRIGPWLDLLRVDVDRFIESMSSASDTEFEDFAQLFSGVLDNRLIL